MYRNLDQNRTLKRILTLVAVFMVFGFVLALPFEEVVAQNALGTFYGGRIIYFSPGYPWVLGIPPLATYGVCPPHMVIYSFGAPYRGVLALTVPPLSPRANYNWYVPGNAVKGAYMPIPITPPNPISCPYDAPVLFPHTLGGTSAVPAW